jgi:hypothetical protein
MPFIRKIRPSFWAKVGNPLTPQALDQAAEDLLADGPIASVYECPTLADAELVALALAANMKGEAHISYVELDHSVITAAGITIDPNQPGATAIAVVNALHRDLALDRAKAEVLVAAISQGAPVFKRVVMARLRTLAPLHAVELRAKGPIGLAWLLK